MSATPVINTTTTTIDWANQEVCRYLLGNVLPVVDDRFYSMTTIPKSFSSIDAARAFVACLNNSGHHYRIRNTKKSKDSGGSKDKAHYISYRCTLCNKPLAFSKPKCSGSSIVHPTSGSSLCNCPRGPKSGNKLQRFPKQETDTALSSLLRAGVVDVLSECDDTIARVLRDECGLVLADTVLAARVKEEYEKESVFLDNSHNDLARKFADYVAARFQALAYVEVCENGAGETDTCFVLSQQPQPSVTAVHILTARSQKRGMDHFAAFVAGAATPFAWGSALIREDGRNNGQWFEGRVRAVTCEVAPAAPVTYAVTGTPEVQRILSSNYNAFGLAAVFFVHCTGVDVRIEDVLSAQAQAGSPITQSSTAQQQPQPPQQEALQEEQLLQTQQQQLQDADAYAQMMQYSYSEQQQQQQTIYMTPPQQPQFCHYLVQGPDGAIYCYNYIQQQPFQQGPYY